MRAADLFAGKRVGILGMARSGVAAARFLRDAGAQALVFDDAPEALARALGDGHKAGQLADVAALDALVVSPGIPLTHPAPHPLVDEARRHDVPLTCDVELFAQVAHPRPLVGITGTNGKSTTAALAHHLLRASGRPALLGGNIGRAVFDLELGPDDQPIVLELSSFQLDLCTAQLDLCTALRCRVAVWLNLTADHLDRHGTTEAYAAAKERIFAHQREGDVAIVGVDDERSRLLAERLDGSLMRVVRVSTRYALAGGVYVLDGRMIDDTAGDTREVARLSGLSALRGLHNHQNAAAAYAAARGLGLEADEAAADLASFRGLPHRMEDVARRGGVLFVNDSKATNPQAAIKSLASFTTIYWIAGGKPKPGGFTELRPFLSGVREAFLIGDAAQEMARDLRDLLPCRLCGTLDEAVSEAFAAARSEARADAVVLLAPACASFDQFTSFEARGDRFRELAQTLSGEEEAHP